jgi:SAM-dependent methyltransferase
VTEGFYATYDRFKGYATPALKTKHVRRYDAEFWRPAACAPGMAVLEVGCGTGLFLAYLRARGVADFLGLDHDPELAGHIPPEVADRFRVADVWRFLAGGAEGRTFDRVALFDVLEHFAPEDGVRLLQELRKVLRPGGRMVARVPNVASPWGLAYQYGDLTHRAAYSPGSLRQLALAAGCVCLGVHPQAEGTLRRRLTEGLLHRLLDWTLVTGPEVWTANVIAVFAAEEEMR